MNKTNTISKLFYLSLLVLTIIITRSNVMSLIHIPDVSLVALIIAGVYFRGFLAPFCLIIAAVLVDNYAIFSQGVSANCITPAYSILPVLYYGVYYFAKFIPSLVINSIQNLLKTSSIIVAIISIEWFLATASYYAFTQALWVDFPSYLLKWSLVEIPIPLYQLLAVSFALTLLNSLVFKSSAIYKK